MKMKIPNLDFVKESYEIIKPHIKRTPILSSKLINEIFSCEIYFKCENFQKVGAFKFRGANNAVLRLTAEDSARGVATHSSGNHAQALALASSNAGIKSYIVMPSNSPKVKVNAVKGYGGEVIFCQPTLEARESTLEQVIQKTGAVFIHPYDNYNIIAGQASSAMELLEDKPELDIIISPVGGGGLLSGTLISAKSIKPNIKVIASEPQGADDAYRSWKAGHIIPSVNPNTICDGLRTSLSPLTFEIISLMVDDIITVSDDLVLQAMKLIAERMKIVVEPSAATTLAVIIKNPEIFVGKKVGLILSGGNIDYADFVNYLSKLE